MGCDIHAFVEHAWITRSDGSPYWQTFISNAGNRDYRMFGWLAGVRSDREPLFPLKSLPDDMSWGTRDYMWMRVVDEPDPDQRQCTAEQAAGWGEEVFDVGSFKYCNDPDLHSHSWLTLDEFKQVLAQYMINHGPYAAEWDAMKAAMEAFEKRGAQTRLVFAFDN